MCGFKVTFELWPESYYLVFSSGEDKTVASRLGLLTSRPYCSIPSMLGWIHGDWSTRSCNNHSSVSLAPFGESEGCGRGRKRSTFSRGPTPILPWPVWLAFNLWPPAAGRAAMRSSLQSESVRAAPLVQSKALLPNSSLASGLLVEIHPELNMSHCLGWRKDIRHGFIM